MIKDLQPFDGPSHRVDAAVLQGSGRKFQIRHGDGEWHDSAPYAFDSEAPSQYRLLPLEPEPAKSPNPAATNKTLGQVAFEASEFLSEDGPWTEAGSHTRRLWERIANAVREEVLWREDIDRLREEAIVAKNETIEKRAEIEQLQRDLEDRESVTLGWQCKCEAAEQQVASLKDTVAALKAEIEELSTDRTKLYNQLWEVQGELANLMSPAIPDETDWTNSPDPRCEQCRGYGKYGGERCDLCNGNGLIRQARCASDARVFYWLTVITDSMTGHCVQEWGGQGRFDNNRHGEHNDR